MDLSNNTELTKLAEVARDVMRAAEGDGAEIFVAGAVARDLWLLYGHNIQTGRVTEDFDFAVPCRDWAQFEAITRAMSAEAFAVPDPKMRHRFRHRNGTPADLLPFGGIERADRTIAWPPDESFVMNLLGFSEVRATAVPFKLPGGIEVPVISLPSLAALKLLAWRDRRERAPRKDAEDLYRILSNYSAAGNHVRMFEEIPGLEDRQDFDFEQAGAELLGRDLAGSAKEGFPEQILDLFEEEIDSAGELRLAREMNRADEEAARLLLAAFFRGLRKQ